MDPGNELCDGFIQKKSVYLYKLAKLNGNPNLLPMCPVRPWVVLVTTPS